MVCFNTLRENNKCASYSLCVKLLYDYSCSDSYMIIKDITYDKIEELLTKEINK